MTALIIDAAVSKLAEGSGKAAAYATIVQGQDHTNVCNRMLAAVRNLQNDRKQAKASNLARVNDPELNGVDDGTSEERAQKVLAPEYMFTFVQRVANQIMWDCRAIKIAQERSEMEALDNGIDFSQEMSDDAGVEYGNIDKLTEQVDEAMRHLNFLHMLLQDNKRLGYLDNINPLFSHAVSVEEDGQYVQKFIAESFPEALVALQDSMDAMNERRDEEAAEADNAIDFDEVAA